MGEWISKRYPLFLTGMTTEKMSENKVPSYFANVLPGLDNQDSQEGEGVDTYSSIVLVYRGELVKTPLKLRAAVYPIAKFDDSILICTTNPKQGPLYAKLDAYESNDLVLVSMSAFDRNEIAEIPYEMSVEYIKIFIYSVRNIAKLTDVGSLKCFMAEQLNKFTWSNEFVKQDYFDSFQKSCSFLFPVSSDMMLPLSLRTFYVDLKVKIGDYSFEKLSFPVNFGQIIAVSSGLHNFPRDIEISFGNKLISGSDLRLDKINFNQTINTLSGDFGMSIFENERDDYERWSYGEHNLYVPTEQARKIVNSLGEERTLTLRLNFEPRRVPASNPLQICHQERLQLQTIPFVLQSFKVLQ